MEVAREGTTSAVSSGLEKVNETISGPYERAKETTTGLASGGLGMVQVRRRVQEMGCSRVKYIEGYRHIKQPWA